MQPSHKQRVAMEMLQQHIAKTRPDLLTPEARSTYIGDVFRAEADAAAEVARSQAEWADRQVIEDAARIPVVEVVPGKAGGYRAMWGSKDIPIGVDMLGKSLGRGHSYGVVVTKGSNLPLHDPAKRDTFMTLTEAVTAVLEALNPSSWSLEIADAAEAHVQIIEEHSLMGDDLYDVLDALTQPPAEFDDSEAP